MERKKLILVSIAILVVLLNFIVIPVEASSSIWTQTYGGEYWDYACSFVEDSDGGYIIAGTTFSFDKGQDFWLIKTDEFSYVEWNRTYGGTGNDVPRSMIVTSDGGYLIVGTTGSFGAGSDDFWLIKTDGLGNVEWNQTYGGTNADYGRSVVETSDGGYAIVGYTGSFGAGGGDFWLVKIDASGNIEWDQTYGGTSSDSGRSVVETSDGGYALIGYTDSFGAGYSDFWLVKTDVVGNMEWNQTYGGTDSDSGYSLVETSDGGYALTGYTVSFATEQAFIWFGSYYDSWLVKTDTFGNVEWNQTYGGPYRDLVSSLIVTSDGGYALAGYTESFGAGNDDFWLIKTDELGNVEWNQTYGGTANDVAYSLVATVDGGYAIVGYTEPFIFGKMDIWLVKTDEYGVVPEYSSWLLTSILLVATSVIVVYKKKLFNERPQSTNNHNNQIK